MFNLKSIKMKNLIKILTVIIVTAMMMSCDEEAETIDFTAHFYTDLAGFVESTACTAPKSILNTQVGAGTGTLIGAFETTITFCVDPSTLEYDNGVGSFIGENGDEIYFEGSGQVRPSDHPDYDLEFQDSFTITGGKGRFEGASGTLVTDSYVKNETQRTDHIWTGKITLDD